MFLIASLLLQMTTITIREPIPPDSGSVESSFSCNGETRVTFKFGNYSRYGRRGVVTRVAVDDTEVPELARHLTLVAQNRSIESIVVRACGPDRKTLRINAIMTLSDVASRREGLEKWHVFTFDRAGLVTK